MKSTNLLKGLNDKQRQAVQTTQGPLLVMASAGSGKTKVLTRRVAYLIHIKHISPYHILAITFTHKAADEMKNRINQLLHTEHSGVWVSTFHKLCIRILRENANLVGFHKNFSIAGSSTPHTLVKDIMKKTLNIDIKLFSPQKVLNVIELAKDKLITPGRFKRDVSHRSGQLEKIAAKVYPIYQYNLQQNQLMDFNDLIMKTVLLFKNHPHVLNMCQWHFRYIHVDEYQDTNKAQYELVNLLASAHHNLCVVGDADQSIYGWRGADMNNILDFSKDYPDAHVIYMEQNYRSTKNILKVANAVISYNRNRVDKQAWTANPKGAPVTYFNAPSDIAEGRFVLSRITALQMTHHLSLNDFAVLYRTNAQSSEIEDVLFKAGIKYQIIGGEKFYDRKEIQDVIAYLSLISNPADDYSFERIVNTPRRGIGRKTLDKLIVYARQHRQSLFHVILLGNMNNISMSVRARNSLREFGYMIQGLVDNSQTESLGKLTKQVIEQSGYIRKLEQDSDSATQAGKHADDKIDNLKHLVSIASQFDTDNHALNPETRLIRFLGHVQLMASQDQLDDKTPRVTLMTIHASKGLEYPVVFMIGMEDGLFPSERNSVGPALEEERRLAYVGVTRAQRKLYLTSAQRRMVFGHVEWREPSMFIKEMWPCLKPIQFKSYNDDYNHFDSDEQF